MLDEAKILSDDINAKQKIADATEKKINESRAGYDTCRACIDANIHDEELHPCA